MPIIFSVVSQGITVLAKRTPETYTGNFDEFTGYILAQIPLICDAHTYKQGPYLIHYVCEHGIIYLCITDDAFPRSRGFDFLIEIKRRFERAYGTGVLNVLPHVINTEFSLILATEMIRYSSSDDIESTSGGCSGIDEIKEIITRSVERSDMSGEHVRLLVRNTVPPARALPVITPEERRALFWKSVMFYSFIAFVHVLVVYVVGSIICGFTWQECI